jgi:hypothetical protein
MGRIIFFLLIGFFTVFAHAKPLIPDQVPEPLTPSSTTITSKNAAAGIQLGMDFIVINESFTISWNELTLCRHK